MSRLYILTFAILNTLLPATTILAQSESSGYSGMLEEIVVTARKRNENLQEVPESVTLINESMVADAGLNDIRGITELTPNLFIRGGYRKGVANIIARGISTPQFGVPPVAVVVDGAAVPNTEFINQGIFDVDNIQVLRGPQGSLYGRGALAGAILITTKQPTDDLSGNMQVGYGSGDDLRLSGAVSGPLIKDKLYYRVGGFYHDRDGQIRKADREHVDFVDHEYAIRGMLQFRASEDLTMELSYKRVDEDSGNSSFGQVPAAAIDDESSYDDINVSFLGRNIREIDEVTFKLNWDLEFASLISITSYVAADDNIFNDGDDTANPFVIFWTHNDKTGLTEEIRLISPDDQSLRWMLGFFYQERDWQYDFNFALDSGLDPTLAAGSTPAFSPDDPSNGHDIDSNSTDIAVFGHLAWDITDKLELSAALRYDHDDRDFLNPPAGSVTRREKSFSELQPKISLAYSISDDDLLYVSLSRGFRSGGFNSLIFAFQPGGYNEEITSSVEVGFKSSWMNNRIILNGAAFYIDADDYQITRFDPFSVTLGEQNIKEVTTQGVEFELLAEPIENLEIRASYGYTDAEMDKFNGTGDADDVAFSGNVVPSVPNHTFNGSIAYTYSLNDSMSLRGYLSYEKLGRIYWIPGNYHKSESQDFLNARLTLQMKHLSFSFFADNLTDERTLVDMIDYGPALLAVAPNRPRSLGISARYNF